MEKDITILPTNSIIWKRLFQILLPFSILVLISFLVAGSLNWIYGWIYILGYLLLLIINTIINRNNLEMIKARSESHNNTEAFDRIYTMIAFLFWALSPIIGALDYRFHWSIISIWFTFFGLLIYLIFSSIFGIAMKANRHFETRVRLQSDRDHQVIKTGSYKIVRHPGYICLIFQNIVFPLIIGSWWVYLTVFPVIFLTIWRTAREDAFLHLNLEGYKEYTKKTKYRLIPGIW